MARLKCLFELSARAGPGREVRKIRSVPCLPVGQPRHLASLSRRPPSLSTLRTTAGTGELNNYRRGAYIGSLSIWRSNYLRAQPIQQSASRAYHPGQRQPRWATTTSEPRIETIEDETGHPITASIRTSSQCTINIVDISVERVVKNSVPNQDLSAFLENEKKPDWAAYRWIYVNGLDLDVVKTLLDSHKIHRLALEDVVHTDTPTKVDWYSDYNFVVMTLQKLVCLQQPQNQNHDSESAIEQAIIDNASVHARGHKWPMLSNARHTVHVEQVSAFLTGKGTIITLFEQSGPQIFDAINQLLSSDQSILRSSNDPSMLLHAVIDAIVDLSLPIGSAFGEAFRELECDVLMRPSINQSRQLYALRSELILLRDMILPIGSVVRVLREHYGIGSTETPMPPSPQAQPISLQHDGTTPVSPPSSPPATTNNLISPITRTYLADVHDHINFLANTTHTTIRSAENLTSLIFNTIAAKQNESVRQLTLVSIFFLPLTFLTGYFGMNFDPMPIVNENSDAAFWMIAGPLMVSILGVMGIRALWGRRGVYRSRRRMRARESRR